MLATAMDSTFSPLMLISNLQLCLAHYCDLHGPTPLMVTEGLPVPCQSCFDHDAPFAIDSGNGRPRTAAAHSHSIPSPNPTSTDALANALRNINFASPRSSSVPASEQEAQSHRTAMLRANPKPLTSESAIETPPDSPRTISEPMQQKPITQANRRDSSYRKTYDDYVMKRANPCENCALTIPKKSKNSTRTTLRADARGPMLRTKAPYAKVFAGGPGGQDSSRSSSNNSQASFASGDSDAEDALSDRLRRSMTDSTTSNSSDFSGSAGSSDAAHLHFLEYISTKEPLLPASFSMIRNSCLRTLSFETLPRTPTTTTTTPPNTSPQTPSLPSFAIHAAGTAATGGPIFFGDPLNGFTTAYIFRIPDVHARGHKRVYAFLALSTHRERTAVKTLSFIASAFRDLAAWIQTLAEAEAERAADQSTSPVVGPGPHGVFPPTSVPFRDDIGTSAFDRASSFLSGGGAFARRMGGGGGGGIALRSRGLPELVGCPDFFIQLHIRFVTLMLELAVKVNS